MLNQSYEQMMFDALAFTMEMKLDISDIRLSSYSVQSVLIHEIFSQYLNIRQFTYDQMCLNCFKICIDLHSFLLTTRSLETILTSGNFYENNNIRFSQSKEEIKSMLGSTSAHCKFHTWLTVGNHIFDPTIMFALFYRDKNKGSYRYTEEEYASVVFQRTEKNQSSSFKYEPVFLGKSYFLETVFIPSR